MLMTIPFISAASYVQRWGYDIPFNDINHYPSISRVECQSICDGDVNCKAYVTSSDTADTSECWTKSSWTSIIEGPNEVRFTHYKQ